ncbi:uncharacterized protein LOC119402080 isoform X2 [Rhipicephalus sanguineus]|uniref:uncharacterized protein LOC119402080 isoform X2 n=1 Tax=Rhipicephalus sanguineus TaxID=34632 RepID=UPI001895F10D|nr:uncharacterized protein LOC119402080 isoform X2 [Rhipicephalus sanguineus]
MGHALLFHVVLLACFFHVQFARHVHNASKGKHKLNGKCLIEPTVEDCNSILLSWSYSTDTGTCDKGFVCAECANRFETQEQCRITCPEKPVQKPRWKLTYFWDCKRWLVHISDCQGFWFEYGKTRFGTLSQQLYYSGCGPDKKKVYKYDFGLKKCHVVDKLPGGPFHQTPRVKQESKSEAQEARQRIRQIVENETLPPSHSGRQTNPRVHLHK